jgi:hypothetical protein
MPITDPTCWKIERIALPVVLCAGGRSSVADDVTAAV